MKCSREIEDVAINAIAFLYMNQVATNHSQCVETEDVGALLCALETVRLAHIAGLHLTCCQWGIYKNCMLRANYLLVQQLYKVRVETAQLQREINNFAKAD